MLKAMQIRDYWVIVSNKEIINPCQPSNICMAHKSKPCDKCGKWQGRKPVAHNPIGNAPIIEGIPLFDAPWEEDVEIEDIFLCKDSFISGYNKHAEKYKYTEEDVENAMFKMANYVLDSMGTGDAKTGNKCDEIIQSLNRKEYEVTIEMEEILVDIGCEWADPQSKYIPKIVDGKVIIKSFK